jgi:hypothetical protein
MEARNRLWLIVVAVPLLALPSYAIGVWIADRCLPDSVQSQFLDDDATQVAGAAFACLAASLVTVALLRAFRKG